MIRHGGRRDDGSMKAPRALFVFGVFAACVVFQLYLERMHRSDSIGLWYTVYAALAHCILVLLGLSGVWILWRLMRGGSVTNGLPTKIPIQDDSEHCHSAAGTAHHFGAADARARGCIQETFHNSLGGELMRTPQELRVAGWRAKACSRGFPRRRLQAWILQGVALNYYASGLPRKRERCPCLYSSMTWKRRAMVARRLGSWALHLKPPSTSESWPSPTPVRVATVAPASDLERLGEAI